MLNLKLLFKICQIYALKVHTFHSYESYTLLTFNLMSFLLKNILRVLGWDQTQKYSWLTSGNTLNHFYKCLEDNMQCKES